MNDFSDLTQNDHLTEEGSGFALLSHDLRSSLAGVLGSLSLVRPDEVSEAAQKQLTRARASALMLQEMLNLAFDMSGEKTYLANSGDLINVTEELAVIADIWTVQAEIRGHQFSVKVADDLPLLQSSDRVSFHRVVNNLISNSNKYSNNGDVAVTVRYAGDETVKMTVADTGPGFSAEAMEMLFQFRGRPENSEISGSGLGLYIASTLVKNMGGLISARNLDTGGAIVEIELPVDRTEVVVPEKTAKTDLPDLSKLKILLAEDNVTNQLVVTQMLKTLGASYEIASDGVEALDYFNRDDFDLVLLDIEMPRKSGLEVLREIRARNDRKADIPLVALTAYVMQEHRDRIESAGANGIIAKPIEGIASLGHSILGYMTNSPVAIGVKTIERMEDDIGAIDLEIYQGLVNVIGKSSMSELLEKVSIDLTTIKENLANAEVQDDLNEMRAASHTLISVAGAIGATNLQKSSEALNAATKTSDGDKRQSLNMVCIKGISEVLAFVAAQ